MRTNQMKQHERDGRTDVCAMHARVGEVSGYAHNEYRTKPQLLFVPSWRMNDALFGSKW